MYRCRAGEEEVKKCTPFSNTECRKRNPSPTQSSQPFPTPSPTSATDISNFIQIHTFTFAVYFKRHWTLICFCSFQLFPCVLLWSLSSSSSLLDWLCGGSGSIHLNYRVSCLCIVYLVSAVLL